MLSASFFLAPRYKGVATCFDIMNRSYAGKYVPFDVFRLYQDKAMENALTAVFQMMLDTPLDDMMVGVRHTNLTPYNF